MKGIKNRLGRYLRENHPTCYAYCMFFMNIFSYKVPTIAIQDSLGGSFKEYISSQDMRTRIELLKNNMDTESLHVIDVIYLRILNYPESKYNIKVSTNKQNIVGGLLDVEKKSRGEFLSDISYIFPHKSMDVSVFYFKHGLEILPKSIGSYILNRDFVDIGAFIGDSALVFSRYNCKKIYSIEISEQSIQKYKKTMQDNHVDPALYEIINMGVADRDDLEPLYLTDNGSSGFSLKRNIGRGKTVMVKRKSLDTIVKEYCIQPGFIKADIEGAALDMVKGAVETLRQYRPVLSFAIYHNPQELFEVKPFLENILTDYVYCIRKLSPGINYTECHSEVFLLAYPKEIAS